MDKTNNCHIPRNNIQFGFYEGDEFKDCTQVPEWNKDTDFIINSVGFAYPMTCPTEYTDNSDPANPKKVGDTTCGDVTYGNPGNCNPSEVCNLVGGPLCDCVQKGTPLEAFGYPDYGCVGGKTEDESYIDRIIFEGNGNSCIYRVTASTVCSNYPDKPSDGDVCQIIRYDNGNIVNMVPVGNPTHAEYWVKGIRVENRDRDACAYGGIKWYIDGTNFVHESNI